MKRGLLVCVCTLLLSLPVVQNVSAQNDGGMQIGLQAGTHFGGDYGLQRGLVGCKIQLNNVNLAITPKLGIETFSIIPKAAGSENTTLFLFNLGSGVDYYIPGMSVGNLHPYVGGDILLGIGGSSRKGTKTQVSFIIYPHIGAEYWIARQFSVGAHFGTDITISVNDAQASLAANAADTTAVGWGIGGGLNVTWYFN